MLSGAIYATPFLFSVQLRSTYGNILQYYLQIVRLVNIGTSYHFQTIPQNRKHKVGNLFSFQFIVFKYKAEQVVERNSMQLQH